MKPFAPFESRLKLRIATILLLPAAILWTLPLAAAPVNPAQASKTNSIRSAFVVPANPSEGRDPFFPTSTRAYESAMASSPTNTPVEVNALVVRGVSGSSGSRLVIINNHTFAAGDIADVITEQGRLRVHCIEIKLHSVIIEVRGQYHELPLNNL